MDDCEKDKNVVKENVMNIIFDMDGVIFDTERLYHACSVPAAEKLGLTGMEKVSYECIGLTEDETNKKLLAFCGDKATLDKLNQEMSRIFMEHYEAEGLPLKEGAAELLAYLKGAGATGGDARGADRQDAGVSGRVVRTAIASSTRSDLVKKELGDAGLLQYFDVIVGGEMASASKPAPDIFLLAAEKLSALGVEKQDAAGVESQGASEVERQGSEAKAEKDMKQFIVIEDSFNGVRAAHAAGATVLMVPDLLEPTPEIRALTDYVFDSLVDVQAWLEKA